MAASNKKAGLTILALVLISIAALALLIGLFSGLGPLANGSDPDPVNQPTPPPAPDSSPGDSPTPDSSPGDSPTPDSPPGNPTPPDSPTGDPPPPDAPPPD